MELTKEELAFLVKVLSQIENEEAKTLLDKVVGYQRETNPELFAADPISLIRDYRLTLSTLMKEMRQYSHESPEADVLSKKAEEIIRSISELERQMQGH